VGSPRGLQLANAFGAIRQQALKVNNEPGDRPYAIALVGEAPANQQVFRNR
jgi:hypothetical protein